MWNELLKFIITNFFTLTLGIGLLVMPSTKFTKRDKQDIIVKVTVALTMVIAILDRQDQYYESLSYPTFARTLVSVINYILRPSAIMLLGLAIAPSFVKKIWIYVPIGVVAAIHTSSFYSDICVSFNENNGFVRGPLGYTSAIITFLYLFIDIAIIVWEHRGRAYEEMIPLFFVAAAASLAGILELLGQARNLLNGGIVLGCLFYHIFMYRMRSKSDLLTELYNRQQLYSDIVKSKKLIKTVISIDMNGLKKLNDTKGHAAGDKALRTIGAVIKKNISYNERGYRIGGDEFVVLSRMKEPAYISQWINRVEGDLFDSGIECSFGYVTVTEFDDIENALQNADEMMYREKREYYDSLNISKE